MDENGSDAAEKIQGDYAERDQDQKEKECDLVEKLHREAVDYYRRNPPPIETSKGIHYTELSEAKPDSHLCHEWNTYRREVGRLLSEGHEGKFVLVKDTTIIGIFDSQYAAYEEGLKRYLLQPMLVHEIRTLEPILRIRGYNMPWPNSLFRLSQPD